VIGILSHLIFFCCIPDAHVSDAALTEPQRFWYLRLLKRLDTLSLEEIFTSRIEDDDGRKEAQALIARAMSQSVAPKAKTKTYQQLMNLLMVRAMLSLGLLAGF
jgi:hypothetical protein